MYVTGILKDGQKVICPEHTNVMVACKMRLSNKVPNNSVIYKIVVSGN